MLLVYQITSYGQSIIVAKLATTLNVNGDYDGYGKKEDAWVSYKTVGNNSYCFVNFSTGVQKCSKNKTTPCWLGRLDVFKSILTFFTLNKYNNGNDFRI